MYKLDNKGVSLLELLLAMTIATFVLGAIAVFIMSSTSSYSNSETEVTVQTEAQLIMNQISDKIINCNNLVFDDSAAGGPLLKIYKGTGGDHYPRIEIQLNTTDHKLYLKNINTLADHADPSLVTNELLGEYVTKIDIKDVPTTGSNKTVSIELELETKVKATTYTHKLNNKITLRNRIVMLS